MNRKIILPAIILLVMILIGSAPTTVTTAKTSNVFDSMWTMKVDKRLLSDEPYLAKSKIPFLSNDDGKRILDLKTEMGVKRVINPTEGMARVMIIYKGGEEVVNYIKAHAKVYGGYSGEDTGVVFAWVTKDQVKDIAINPQVVSIMLQSPIDISPPKQADANNPINLPFQTGGGGYSQYMAPVVTGATYAWSKGYNGSGVKVAVVDTGIDMGESDLGLEAIARDNYGLPLLFDADEMGLVLTLNPTTPVNDSAVRVEPNVTIGGTTYNGIIYYDAWDGSLWLTNNSLVLAIDFATWNFAYTIIPVANKTFLVPSTINLSETNVTFGLISQNLYIGTAFVWLLVPAIMADTNADGYYDSAYIDLSMTYYLLKYAFAALGYGNMPNESLVDFSFADEPQITYGNEIAARDFTGDGVNDVSLGALSQAFMDANGLFDYAYNFGWFNDAEYTGWILPGLDPYGAWFDLVFDSYGHGTECAHVIASRGNIPRPTSGPFGMETNLSVTGIAPGATIGGAPALWTGNVVIAQLYLSGWDLVDPSSFFWIYTGDHKVDVISNSWGSSYLLLNGFASDADVVSLFENFITMTTGTVIVHAAGNGGPGFGSVTMPGAASQIITVGASTLFYYRPVYGYMPGGYDQVVSWSDRGPTQFGYPKPDIVNIGSFEYSIGRVIDGFGDGLYTLDIFGGTSEATPMTSGAVAIIIQALRENNISVTPTMLPFLVKSILKSSARDLGYDPFSQGSGHVDIEKAIKLIEEGYGVLAFSTDTPSNIAKLLDETMATLVGVDPETIDQLYSQTFDSALYFGVVKPGTVSTMNLTLTSFGTSKKVSIEPVYLKKTIRFNIWRFIDIRKSQVVIPGKGGGNKPLGKPYAWISGSNLYMNLSALPPGSRLLLAINPFVAKYFSGDHLRIVISYPYEVMDPEGRNGSYRSYFMMGSELSYWVDITGDNKVDVFETGRMQYDIREGNTMQLQLGYPSKAYDLTKDNILEFLYQVFGIDASTAMNGPVLDLRIFTNDYINNNGSKIVKFNGYMETYRFASWKWVKVKNSVEIPNEVKVSVRVPRTAKPGVYEGYLKISDGSTTTLVPISVAVPQVIDARTYMAKITPTYQREYYDNYMYTGALDQGWRPEVGDWRTFPILIDNSMGRIGALEVSVKWDNPTSSFDVGVIGSGFNNLAVDVAYGGIPMWIDSAVLAAKLSTVDGGVYEYFDYPTSTQATVIAPVGPTSLDNYNSKYLLYWVVVHQVFTSTGFDSPTIELKVYKQITNNIYNIAPGKALTKFQFVRLGDTGFVNIDTNNTMIIPLDGATGDINLSITSRVIGSGRAVWMKTTVTASNNASGTFIVMIPIVTDAPSVVWGNIEYGETYLYYDMPAVFYVTLVVNVK